MAEHAECLGSSVDALGLQQPHVLGRSWGSALALELYRQRPTAARSFVLVGAYAGWAGSLPPDEVEQRLQFALSVADLASGMFEPASMPGLFTVMPGLGHECSLESAETFDEEVRSFLRAIPG